VAATSNLVGGTSAILISVTDALLAQTEKFNAAVNDGLGENGSIVSATQATNISTEVFVVSGVSDVSVSAGADAGEATSSVGPTMPFQSCSASISPT